ncbi:hypothetical protein DUNSADRAFT_12748 [Dunaliella salina]|uniref:Uncharacterized protein n=1 Tax=Dunaliella salina TaxID=3046 RepID=A0ABQ7GAU0_DUNSA|nr:hypothetical protein DUNSADRAFT_12748 [Dunaliella salina]|eukprot:KAF5831668.1 hypothetical protein DUNSADRAFT_12748 [Dunaliella salina]
MGGVVHRTGLPSSSILLGGAFGPTETPPQGPISSIGSHTTKGAHTAVPANSNAASEGPTPAAGRSIDNDDGAAGASSGKPKMPASATPWGVNKGLEAAAQLLSVLHEESRDDPLLMEEAPELDPRTCNPQFAQGTLSEHLDSCAAAIRERAGPGIFPSVGAGSLSQGSAQCDESAAPSSTTGMQGQEQLQQQQQGGHKEEIGARHENQEQQQQLQQQQFLAIQTLMYQHLKLKHEPIEWVYDGLAPLMLQEVLHRRKTGTTDDVYNEYNVYNVYGPTTLSMPEDVPHDVAVRHAGRGAVSGIPTDAWLVSGLLQPPGSTDGSVFWRPSGIFLDVSCRGGAVLTAEQAQQRYGEGENEQEGAIMPWHKGCVWRPEGVLAAGCAELARATMVAHQRRGESDLVVHWLYQLLALDPTASEWEQMQA